MSRTQDPAEDPYMQSRDMSSLLDSEPTIQERITSQPDQIDDGTPPFYTESNPPETPNSSSDYEDEKVSYNGPSTTHIVMLRVSKESSARPMPQAAFFNHNKALAFSTRILLQWCDAHYDDYVWKGPESLRGGLMERYAAYHAQTGQQLAVADVIKVSIFDVKETEGIVKGEDEEEGSGEYGEEEDDEHRHKEQFGEGPHEEYFEERSDEDQDDSETIITHSTQTDDQEVDLGERRDDSGETLPAIYTLQAAAEYAMDLATRRATHSERGYMGRGSHRGAWREDYEMRVFGGPTE